MQQGRDCNTSSKYVEITWALKAFVFVYLLTFCGGVQDRGSDLRPLHVAVRVNDVTTPYFRDDITQIVTGVNLCST